jgi:hypothetical protein
VSAFVTAGAGFLLAVLWFDLMFDIQTIAHRGRELPEEVLASIACYYARVTTAARPMNRLIALVMLATLAAIVVELTDGHQASWVPWASLAPERARACDLPRASVLRGVHRRVDRAAAWVCVRRGCAANANRLGRPGRVAQWESARFTRGLAVGRGSPDFQCPSGFRRSALGLDTAGLDPI